MIYGDLHPLSGELSGQALRGSPAPSTTQRPLACRGPAVGVTSALFRTDGGPEWVVHATTTAV
ncbi:hypothetical protein HEK616_22780 [Streptomyces nigrescens]|uniref:Uncharacterized protein n=1 Tax=Streptomyces nigrescens TaxID=1920 RepID=A0ABM7ZR37_STRNI|nr:hypothetical protein HEK616_22780 [Streptomyces nigrescens]